MNTASHLQVTASHLQVTASHLPHWGWQLCPNLLCGWPVLRPIHEHFTHGHDLVMFQLKLCLTIMAALKMTTHLWHLPLQLLSQPSIIKALGPLVHQYIMALVAHTPKLTLCYLVIKLLWTYRILHGPYRTIRDPNRVTTRAALVAYACQTWTYHVPCTPYMHRNSKTAKMCPTKDEKTREIGSMSPPNDRKKCSP
jgi:hypothetical protein